MVFFREWVRTISEEDNLALDITSISSYNQEITAVRSGYDRDHENLEQINLALMVGSKTYRPVFYCILLGNINDRASLRHFLSTLDDSFGTDGYKIVMDEGFCNKANITLMYDMKLKFTISLTKSLSFTSDAIDEAADTIESFSNYHQIIGSNVFLTTSLKDWGGHRCYTHVYYDETKRYNDRKRFMDRLDKCRALLEKNETLPEFEVPFAEIYFTINETPKRGSKVIPNET